LGPVIGVILELTNPHAVFFPNHDFHNLHASTPLSRRNSFFVIVRAPALSGQTDCRLVAGCVIDRLRRRALARIIHEWERPELGRGCRWWLAESPEKRAEVPPFLRERCDPRAHQPINTGRPISFALSRCEMRPDRGIQRPFARGPSVGSRRQPPRFLRPSLAELPQTEHRAPPQCTSELSCTPFRELPRESSR
jgi:hypothetical protein